MSGFRPEAFPLTQAEPESETAAWVWANTGIVFVTDIQHVVEAIEDQREST